MTQEPMKLPEGQKLTSGDDSKIVENPASKKFWRLKNVIGYLLVLVTPLALIAALKYGHDAVVFFNNLKGEIASIKSAIVSRDAVWTAVSDVSARAAKLEMDIQVINRLFDREFGRGVGAIGKDVESGLTAINRERAALEELKKLIVQMVEEHKKRYPDSKVGVVPPISSPASGIADPKVTAEMIQQFLQATVPSPSPRQFGAAYERMYPSKLFQSDRETFPGALMPERPRIPREERE